MDPLILNDASSSGDVPVGHDLPNDGGGWIQFQR